MATLNKKMVILFSFVFLDICWSFMFREVNLEGGNMWKPHPEVAPCR